MAKLAEGMKRSKTDYGTVYHMYRGVRISKRSSGYEFTIEYVQYETGRILTHNSYAAYQLQDVPAKIDQLLDDEGKYFADQERNIVRLNPDYVEQMRTAALERNEKELAAIHQKMSEALAAAQYGEVEKWAPHAIKVQKQIQSIQSNLQ